jgi:formylglycine-generating enzyme required for sulfatase activity
MRRTIIHSPDSNPAGPAQGQRKGLRGGSFYFGHFGLRAADRSSGDPADRNGNIGFRCAQVLAS